MTPGYSAVEVQAADGARLALHRFAHAYEFAGRAAAIGAVRGPGRWDLGVVCDQGALHCFDLESLQRRWVLGVCAPTSWPVSCVSADLDGDQQDEFLIGLPDGRLIAVAERDGCGSVLWEVRFVAGVNDAIVADIDGDGRAEAIVETDDGYVRVLKSPVR